MELLVLELDPHISERARRLAQARGTTVKAFVQSLIAQFDTVPAEQQSVLGMFADDPAVLDDIVCESMQARETQVLRISDA
jgi:hypothetical protein